MPGVSNTEFAERVGVHHSTVSRLRSGERLPSGHLLTRIVAAYDLDKAEAMDAYAQGEEAFARFLGARVFHPVAGQRR